MSGWKNFYAAILSGVALSALVALPLANKINLNPEEMNPSLKYASIDNRSHEINSLRDLSLGQQTPVAAQWIVDIQSDSFADQTVFEHLSTFEPLTDILKKGIVSFDRKTLRSADYQNADGYDLLVYDIRHPLTAVSRIMASLEKSPDGGAPVIRIIFLTGKSGDTNAELVQFEGDVLSSQKQIAWSEAARLFDRELRDASTLMNASIR